MNKLPVEDPRYDTLFQLAAAAYQRSPETFQSNDDFSKLLAEQGERLPLPIVLYWTNQMLQDSPTESSDHHFALTIASEGGSTTLHSLRQFRLAELLPMLRHIAPARASELEKQHSSAATDARVLEKPMSSIDMTEPSPAVTLSAQKSAMQTQLFGEFLQTLNTDPKQAFDLAKVAPEPLKLEFLAAIMVQSQKTSPSTAVSAAHMLFETTRQVAEQWPDDNTVFVAVTESMRAQELSPAHVDIQQLWCSEIPKVASILYKHDNDVETRNEAPEVYWPSTAIQIKAALRCGKQDSSLHKRVMSEVDDPAIRLLIRVLTVADELPDRQVHRMIQCETKYKNSSAAAVCG
jgi:hypothetical protein